jgi:hypothetical protein
VNIELSAKSWGWRDMRRILAVFALFFAMISFAYAKDSSDVVVLLDTSESMFPYFEQVVDYIVTKVARDYLRQDDTFHLLTFSDTAQLELAQGIKSEEDVRSLISRLYLVYPFGKNTDLISALNYLQQYATDLPERNDKMIVIITDGIHNPSSKSPYALYSEDQALAAVNDIAGKIAQHGWKVSIIRIPFKTDDAIAAKDKGAIDSEKIFKSLQDSMKVNAITFNPESPDSVAQNAMAIPTLEFPSDLGKKDLSFSFPVKVNNVTDDTLRLEVREVQSGQKDIKDGTTFLKLGKGKSGVLKVNVAIPDSVKDGHTELPVRLIFADSVRVSPSSGVISFTLQRSVAFSFFKAHGIQIIVGFILLALIALAILIALMARGMPSKSSATVVAAVKSANAAETGKASYQGQEKYAKAGSSDFTVVSGSAPAPGGKTASSAKLNASKASPRSSSPEVRDLGFVPKDTNAIKLHEADEAMRKANKPSFTVDAKVYEGARGGYATPVEEKKSDAQLREEKRAYNEAADREGEKYGQALMSQLSVKKTGSMNVQMTIDCQNRNVGLRNVHALKSGSRLGVGKSNAFTVFVVNVPRKIAEIYYDGETCHFVPFRKDYFPEISETIHDCLDRDIAIKTPEGFRMNLRLSRWENPTDKLNKLLHIIDIRGLV